MVDDKEITAMAAVAKALDAFEEGEKETVKRILGWACARYGVAFIGRLDHSNSSREIPDRDDARPQGGDQQFGDVADLYDAANPKTEAEKALVVGYWLTVVENKSEFTGQEVNNHLKNLGHGIGNITDSLSKLMDRKPSLVMQTAKSGSARQARKRYKLTRAGLDEVRRMTGRDGEGSC
jgi:hypothetical protein